MNFLVKHGGYPYSVFVSVATGDDTLRRLLGRRFDLTDGDREALTFEGEGNTIMLECGQSVIKMERFDGSPHDLAILSHEVFHAVTLLMDKIGITLDDKSDEAFAYAIQSLTEKIVARLVVKSKTKKAEKPKRKRRMK